MRIKMLALDAGPDGVHAVGAVREIDSNSAAELIAGGYAESLESPESTDADAQESKSAKKSRGSKKAADDEDDAT